MKYLLLVIIWLIISWLGGCADVNTFVHNDFRSREFVSKINNQDWFADVVWVRIRDQEFNRLQDQFNFDRNKPYQSRQVLERDHNQLYVLYELLDNLILDLWHGSSNDYTLRSTEKNSWWKRWLFEVYKDDILLTSQYMEFWAESAIQEFWLLIFEMEDGSEIHKEFFTFYDSTKYNTYRNIWFDNQTINDLYNTEDSSFLFQYDNKIWFVAGKDNKKFIIYDGAQVSELYDNILTFSCCSIIHYPLQIDQNGNFLFLAKKGKKYVFVEIELGSK